MKPCLFCLVILIGHSNMAHCGTLLLFNGKIHTQIGQETQHWLFLKKDRIHSFGKGAPPTLDPEAEQIDLNGLHVFPSFTDADADITGIGRELLRDPKLSENKASDEQLEKTILSAVKEAYANGITGIHDTGGSFQSIETIRKLLKNKTIAFRFYELLPFKDKTTVEPYLARGPEIDSEEGQLTVRTVTFFVDGTITTGKAPFRDPYPNDPTNKELLTRNETELIKAFSQVDRAGFQIAVETRGSLANTLAINALEKALGSKISAKRPRLESVDTITKNDLARIRKLGIVFCMQPTQYAHDLKKPKSTTGHTEKKYAGYFHPWKSLLKEKGHLAFGTGAPIQFLNPWHGLFASLTVEAKDHNHKANPKAGSPPEERFSLTEAFEAFTEGPAYASYSELLLGKIRTGAWADFIVLEKDPFTLPPEELQKLTPLQTWVAGQKVYERSTR